MKLIYFERSTNEGNMKSSFFKGFYSPEMNLMFGKEHKGVFGYEVITMSNDENLLSEVEEAYSHYNKESALHHYIKESVYKNLKEYEAEDFEVESLINVIKSKNILEEESESKLEKMLSEVD